MQHSLLYHTWAYSDITQFGYIINIILRTHRSIKSTRTCFLIALENQCYCTSCSVCPSLRQELEAMLWKILINFQTVFLYLFQLGESREQVIRAMALEEVRFSAKVILYGLLRCFQ